MAAQAQTRRNLTDRAKRYRAQSAVTGPRACVFCGSKTNVDVMHLSGNEDDGEPANLAYGCRSCNVLLAHAFKRIGAGRPTNQYNPAKNTIPSFEQYAYAVSNHTRGAHDAGGAVIHATPKHKRIEYARRIAGLKAGRARDNDRWNPAGKGKITCPVCGLKCRYDVTASGERILATHRVTVPGPECPGSRRAVQSNPAGASAEAFEEFHGHASRELVTVKKRRHVHEHLAAAGVLKQLVVKGVDGEVHTIRGFGKALLCFNEGGNQLFIEGGDQSIDVKEFGISRPREVETLGKVMSVDYATDKSHLGDEGGDAVYSHAFGYTNKGGKHVKADGARLPSLLYRVRDEAMEFSGGSYFVRAEGIDA